MKQSEIFCVLNKLIMIEDRKYYKSNRIEVVNNTILIFNIPTVTDDFKQFAKDYDCEFIFLENVSVLALWCFETIGRITHPIEGERK